MTWVSTLLEHNMSKCEECAHRMGDHHSVMGCQHREPYYDKRGYLLGHEGCPCKEGVTFDRWSEP